MIALPVIYVAAAGLLGTVLLAFMAVLLVDAVVTYRPAPDADGGVRLFWAAVAVLALALTLAGCDATAPIKPTEPKIEYRTVEKPVPVPCFTEAERPVLPPPTPVDLEHATADQIAAAVAADLENERLYAAAVDALFIRCQAAGKAKP